MQCPSCGSENTDRATSCSLCFWPLVDEVPATVSPTEPLAADGAPEPILAAVTLPTAAWESSPTPESAPLPMPEWDRGRSPAPASGPAAGGMAGIDADVYASGMLAAERLRIDPAPVKRGVRVPALGDSVISPVALRFMLGAAVFLIGILVWGFGGGFSGMSQSKKAEIPIPPGARLIATQESITDGALGTLNAERRAMYATRVFLVPLPKEEVFTYYGAGGPGDAALAEQGWTWDPDGFIEENYALVGWRRTATLGYRAKDEQEMLLLVQEQRVGGWSELLYDMAPGQNPFTKITEVSGGAVPGESCIVAVACTGAALEEVEFVEQ